MTVSNNYMPKEVFYRIIDAVKRINVKQKIRFTGGEPLLHKDIKNLIQYVKTHLPQTNIGLTTNGLLLKKKIADILTLNSITVSLHTLDKEKYKTVTNVDGLHTVLE